MTGIFSSTDSYAIFVNSVQVDTAPDIETAAIKIAALRDKDFISDIYFVETNTVSIEPTDTIPMLALDDLTVAEGNTVTATYVITDGTAPFTTSVTTAPINGTVTLDGLGNLTYTPSTGFSGTDSFGVTTIDGLGVSSAELIVSVEVTPSVIRTVIFNVTQVDLKASVWDKSTGFDAGTKGVVDWGDSKTLPITVGSNTGHAYALAGTYTVTVTYVVGDQTYNKSIRITVPKATPPVSPPPPPPPPPPPTGNTSGNTTTTGPDPTTTVRTFSGAELAWRDTESTDVVDVQIQLDPTATQVTWDSTGSQTNTPITLPSDQLVLSISNTPIGVTPLKFADGTDHPDLVITRYKDCVIVENPWPDTQLNYSGTLTVKVNGVQTFQQSSVQFWLRCGTAPIRTGLPQYTPTAPDLSLLPNYGNPGALKEPTPGGTGTAGSYPRLDINGLGYSLYTAMGSTGGRRDIAIIPGWDLPWALQGIYWQACRDANDHSAVWPKRIRSPITGMIMDPTIWGDATLNPTYIKSPNFMHGHVNPIAGMTTCPYKPNVAHQTHFAIVPYLSTQSDFDLEEMLSWACYDAIEGNPSYRQFGTCIATGSTRSIAWTITQWSFTARLLPDSHPAKTNWNAVMQANADYWWGQQYAPGMPKNNPFGIYLDIAYPDLQKRARGIAPWQNHYLAPSLDLAVQHGHTEYAPWRDFSAGFAVNSMANMCYQMGTFYEMFVVDPSKYGNNALTTAQQLWTTWDEVKADCLATSYAGKYADQATLPCGQMTFNAGLGQMSGATGGQQSYPAMLQPALAVAVDAELPNAQAMWDKLMQFGGNIDFTVSNEKNIVPKTQA